MTFIQVDRVFMYKEVGNAPETYGEGNHDQPVRYDGAIPWS